MNYEEMYFIGIAISWLICGFCSCFIIVGLIKYLDSYEEVHFDGEDIFWCCFVSLLGPFAIPLLFFVTLVIIIIVLITKGLEFLCEFLKIFAFFRYINPFPIKIAKNKESI